MLKYANSNGKKVYLPKGSSFTNVKDMFKFAERAFGV